MSGIAVILDLLRKNPNFYSTHTLHSFGSFSAKVAVSGAAASVLASYPFGFRAFLGSNNRVAYCDAAATWNEDHISKDHDEHRFEDLDIPKHVFEHYSLYNGKVYNVDLKPLSSAFHPRTFALTVLRSFLMYYLPLLEPRTALEDDDEDFLDDNVEDKRYDLVGPFYKSVNQIMRESAVITTRRVLEKLVVSCVFSHLLMEVAQLSFTHYRTMYAVVCNFFRKREFNDHLVSSSCYPLKENLCLFGVRLRIMVIMCV